MVQDISFTLHPNELEDETEAKKLKYRCLPAICALLNHPHGGNLVLKSKDGTEFESQASVSKFVKNMETIVNERFRLIAIRHFSLYLTTQSQLVFKVAARPPSSWFSIASNLYLPSDLQLLRVSPAADPEVIHDILNETYKPSGILPQPNPENWTFVEGQSLPSLKECKQVEFKLLESEKEGHTSLVDRIFNNNFASYVSAFANDRGGRIFCGIRDDGVVEGEIFDSKTKLTQEELTEKVAEKITSQIIWPKKREQPEKGKHWDIHFEEVIDGDGRAVPSTFVIIISVAACPGGVFAKKPESYVLVEGKVQRMAFEEWKCAYKNNESKRASRQLQYYRENKDQESFKKKSDQLLKNADNITLVVYSLQAAYAAREGDFKEAFRHPEEFDILSLCNNNDETFLQATTCYRKVRKHKDQGNFETSLGFAQRGLEIATGLRRGDAILAWFYIQCASLYAILARTGQDRMKNMDEARKCAEKALKLADELEADVPLAKVDLKQQVFINQAMIVSKSCLTGEMLLGNGVERFSEADLAKARANLESVENVMQIGVEPSLISNIEYFLAKSDVLFRSSQLHKRGRAELFNEAVGQAKKARRLAEDNSLKEYEDYAQRRLDAFEGSI